MRAEPFDLRVHDDPRQIDAAAWDGLVAADPDASPFVRHAFLSALQSSGAATAGSGWQAQFLTLWQAGRLQAAVPLYAKQHSYGEYVFDWAWAEAQEQLGRPYYPKWLVAVPFTPVAGTRLIAGDAKARAAALQALLGVARTPTLSSLHVLFAPPAQIDTLAAAGLLVRHGVQFHWRNQGYGSFDDFLAALTQPKRKNIRAERRKVREAGVVLERRLGADIREEDWHFFLRCYTSTYVQHGAQPYLNLEFFLTLAQALPQVLMLVLARRGTAPIAAALGVFDRERGALYGRYWGALEAVSCLHFECCYYQMIEFAIGEKLQIFEGGAQGAHKLARGLDPVATQSAHWLGDPALRAAVQRFLARERAAVALAVDEMQEHRAARGPASGCSGPAGE